MITENFQTVYSEQIIIFLFEDKILAKQNYKNVKFDFYIKKRTLTENLYRQFYTLRNENNASCFEELTQMYSTIQNNYNESLSSFYLAAEDTGLEDLDLTIVINFNRELFTSNKAMLMAIKDLTLNEKEAETFNTIPVYTT